MDMSKKVKIVYNSCELVQKYKIEKSSKFFARNFFKSDHHELQPTKQEFATNLFRIRWYWG